MIGRFDETPQEARIREEFDKATTAVNKAAVVASIVGAGAAALAFALQHTWWAPLVSGGSFYWVVVAGPRYRLKAANQAWKESHDRVVAEEDAERMARL